MTKAQAKTEDPDVFTESEAASYLKISRTSVYFFRRCGALKSCMLGKRHVYRKEELQRFLKEREGATYQVIPRPQSKASRRKTGKKTS